MIDIPPVHTHTHMYTHLINMNGENSITTTHLQMIKTHEKMLADIIKETLMYDLKITQYTVYKGKDEEK